MMRNIYNAIGFRIRKALRFRRPGMVLPNEAKKNLFEYASGDRRLALSAREEELRKVYKLDPLFHASSRYIYRDNLYWLEGLERCFDGVTLAKSAEFKIVDVGSNNFHYAFALARFFETATAAQHLDMCGYEIDGHVVYADLHSRADYAAAYLAQIRRGRYVVADFGLSTESGADVATMFFPFLTKDALLWWGLPIDCFSPQALLLRAIACVKPGGFLVVWNQTDEEADQLDGLVSGARLVNRVRLKSDIVDYGEATADRVGSVFRMPFPEGSQRG